MNKQVKRKNEDVVSRGIEWTPIPNCPGYFASREGLILSKRRRNEVVLSPIETDDGHQYIFIFKKKRWVHHLILETFDRSKPNGLQCRHLDGNPGNNRPDNLSWGTQMENSMDRWEHGTMPVGEKSAAAKLTLPQVKEIKKLKGHISSRQVAASYGVAHTTIQKIWRGEHWREQAG